VRHDASKKRLRPRVGAASNAAATGQRKLVLGVRHDASKKRLRPRVGAASNAAATGQRKLAPGVGPRRQ